MAFRNRAAALRVQSRAPQRSVVGLLCLTALWPACDRSVHTLGAVSVVEGPASAGSGDGGAAGSPSGDGDGAPGSPPMPAPVGQDGGEDGGQNSGQDGGQDSGVVEPPPVGLVCERQQAAHRPLEIYLLIDRVVEIPVLGGLDIMGEGVRRFLEAPTQQGLSVAALRIRSACDEGDYPGPDVDWGVLPGHAEAIADGLFVPLAVNVAQAEFALRAALRHAQGRAQNGAKQALVMLTDGLDGGFCSGVEPEGTVQAAGDAMAAVPSIETHVVAMTAPIFDPTRVIPGNISLESLASAGGSGAPVRAPALQGGAAVAEALESAHVAADPCHYVIPPDADGELWLALAGQSDPLPRAENATNCGNLNGFYRATSDGREFLMLCPATCATVKSGGVPDHSRVELVSNCQATAL